MTFPGSVAKSPPRTLLPGGVPRYGGPLPCTVPPPLPGAPCDVDSMVGIGGGISGQQLPRRLSWFHWVLTSWSTCCLELPQSFRGERGF